MDAKTRTNAWRQSMRDKGFKMKTVWVREKDWLNIQVFIARLNKKKQ